MSATEYLLAQFNDNEKKLVKVFEADDTTTHTAGSVYNFTEDISDYKLLIINYDDGVNFDVFTEFFAVKDCLGVNFRPFLTYRYGSVKRYSALTISPTFATVNKNTSVRVRSIYVLK